MKASDSSVSARALRSIIVSCSARSRDGGKAEQAETGIVDHVLRLGALRCQRLAQRVRDIALQEVGDNNQRPAGTGRGDLVGQRIQAIRAPGHQSKFMTVAREIRAPARRRCLRLLR